MRRNSRSSNCSFYGIVTTIQLKIIFAVLFGIVLYKQKFVVVSRIQTFITYQVPFGILKVISREDDKSLNIMKILFYTKRYL